MKPVNSVFSQYGITIFAQISQLALEHQAVNLGQGFPDQDGPDSLKQALDRATREHPNQYPPLLGVPELRQAVARHDQRHYGLTTDWQSEVLVTCGATEALASSFFGLLNPGDEVILLEPLYDAYLPLVQRAGGVARTVRLQPPDWALPQAELQAAFNERTKLLVLNSPMNPTGKVFTRAELQCIAELLTRFDAYAVCDEVYEHLVFDDHVHQPLSTLPGMRQRCVRIGSAGKTFSMTSWKIGYINAAAPLLAAVAKAHQFMVFTLPANLQQAVAHGLDHEQVWYTGLAAQLQRKRDRLATGLEKLGVQVLPSEGTYFINADFSPLGFTATGDELCRRLIIEAGLATVPVSAFYSTEGKRKPVGAVREPPLLRLCFCKQDSLLDQGLARLQAFLSR